MTHSSKPTPNTGLCANFFIRRITQSCKRYHTWRPSSSLVFLHHNERFNVSLRTFDALLWRCPSDENSAVWLGQHFFARTYVQKLGGKINLFQVLRESVFFSGWHIRICLPRNKKSRFRVNKEHAMRNVMRMHKWCKQMLALEVIILQCGQNGEKCVLSRYEIYVCEFHLWHWRWH